MGWRAFGPENGGMHTSTAPRPLFTNTPHQSPHLALRVTDAQRDRAVDYLQGAYAEGRLSATEFDERVGVALAARTRGELNAAFTGLVQIGPTSMALAAHPVYQPLVNQHRDGAPGRVGAGLAHLASIPFPLVAPGLVYAASERGSFVRSQAAKAFNFQLNAILLAMVFGVVAGITDMGLLSAVWATTWFVLTVVGGVKALAGEDFENPVRRLMPLRPLDESTRRSIGR